MHKEVIVPFVLSLFMLLLSGSYYAYFAEALNNDEWEYVDGFTRIVIPDTFFYKRNIDLLDHSGDSILSDIKNTVIPSLIWSVADEEWMPVLFINAALLFIALLYLNGITRLVGIAWQGTWPLMTIIALLPATIYHGIGALKEIPTLLFVTGFFYHYLRGDHVRWLLFALFCIVCRYQLAFSLIFFLAVDRFQRHAFICAFAVLILLSALYPYITWDVFTPEGIAAYRDLYGAPDSTGGIVESVRGKIPIISVFAVWIRIVQSVFEPFLAFFNNPSFYDGDHLSIIAVAYVFSLLPLSYYWLVFSKSAVSMLINTVDIQRNTIRLYTFCLVLIYPIAGFSFIHHRYLYPMTALVLIAGKSRIRSAALQNSQQFRIP